MLFVCLFYSVCTVPFNCAALLVYVRNCKLRGLNRARFDRVCAHSRVPTLRPGIDFHRAGQVLQATVHLVLEGGTGATCQR